MKVKTISRSFEEHTRGSKTEVLKQHKNAAPELHPFEAGREYVRAVTAAKMERMFAHPFLAAMDDHADGVLCSALNPVSLVSYVSGAADGEVIVWDLAARAKLWSVYAHAGFVRGVAVAHDGSHFFSCGDDRTVKQWRLAADDALATADGLPAAAGGAGSAAGAGGAKRSRATMEGRRVRRRRGGDDDGDEDEGATTASATASGDGGAVEPLTVWRGKHAFLYMDAAPSGRSFATASVGIAVWDYERSEPVHSYEWGADSVTTVRYNPAEPSLLASTGADRSVALYDVRTDSALRKVVLSMNANALAWNPREPFNFTAASEDSQLYTFDMRKLAHALMVHKDHVGAVMDVAYSPTGREFVSASYDKTIRIWRIDSGRSREVYHTKRMQRVFTVKVTGDAKYIVSGSDDANVRLWKADASAPLHRLLPRERAKLDYAAALKTRFGHMPEVRRILTSRRLPRGIMKGKEARVTEEQKTRRKLANVRAHTAPDSGDGIPEPLRARRIVAEVA